MTIIRICIINNSNTKLCKVKLLHFRSKYALTVGAFIHFAKFNWHKAELWGKYQIAKAALAAQKPGWFASEAQTEMWKLAEDVVRYLSRRTVRIFTF